MMHDKSININGLEINGTDPIPQDIRAYFEKDGAVITQKDGFVTLSGPFRPNVAEMRVLFPHIFGKYNGNTSNFIHFNENGIDERFLLYSSVVSNSKKDNREKFWLQNPISDIYTIQQAAQDVARGLITKKILDDRCISKVKFDTFNKAVVTRVANNSAPGYSLNELGEIVCASLFGARSINEDNSVQSVLPEIIIVALLTENRKIDISTIMHESTTTSIGGNLFYFNKPLPPFEQDDCKPVSFHDLLPIILNDFTTIYNILIQDDVSWCIPNKSSTAVGEINELAVRTLATGQTQADCNNNFIRIAELVADDNFALCDEVRDTIYSDLTGPISKFTKEEIEEQIMPEVEMVLNELKNNVMEVRKVMLGITYNESNPSKENVEIKAYARPYA